MGNSTFQVHDTYDCDPLGTNASDLGTSNRMASLERQETTLPLDCRCGNEPYMSFLPSRVACAFQSSIMVVALGRSGDNRTVVVMHHKASRLIVKCKCKRCGIRVIFDQAN